MGLLDLRDILDGLARASGVQWYGHVLKRDGDETWKGHWILKW